jgi:acyl-CoA thioesterase
MLDPKISELLGNDRIADYYGMVVESVGEGHSRVSLELGERHLNGIGIPHGGVLFALADVACALAACTRGPAVAASSSINFCKAVPSGKIYAEASEASLSRKLGTYQVLVSDGKGETIAVFSGMAYRRDRP